MHQVGGLMGHHRREFRTGQLGKEAVGDADRGLALAVLEGKGVAAGRGKDDRTDSVDSRCGLRFPHQVDELEVVAVMRVRRFGPQGAQQIFQPFIPGREKVEDRQQHGQGGSPLHRQQEAGGTGLPEFGKLGLKPEGEEKVDRDGQQVQEDHVEEYQQDEKIKSRPAGAPLGLENRFLRKGIEQG